MKFGIWNPPIRMCHMVELWSLRLKGSGHWWSQIKCRKKKDTSPKLEHFSLLKKNN
jgi:hypothetical protein